MNGGLISPEYDAQLRDVIKSDRQRKRMSAEVVEAPQKRKASAFSEHAVILDEDLPAATHALTGASSCLATVCRWSTADEEYVETSLQLTVWNHSENANHVTNTYGVIRFIDGHWHFFGDCHAMASR
jgi:hypothetical protein